MKRKAFQRAFDVAVEAEVERRRLDQPVTFRNLTIDFPARTFSIDGRMYPVLAPMVTMPILNTEQLVAPACPSCRANSVFDRATSAEVPAP